MDAQQFRHHGRQMIDCVADYLENIRDRPVYPDVRPGYLIDQLPELPPQEPETWERVYEDVEKRIMPGITHWHSPHFHAYYPLSNTYPAICADILAHGICANGFTWASSPAITELEIVTLDWMAKALGLPEVFWSSGKGGGVIQSTASESTLLCLLAARTKKISSILRSNPEMKSSDVVSKLVAYTSEEAHSSVQRACLFGGVQCHSLPTDEDLRLRGSTVEQAMKEDMEQGLIPFYVVATLGTTPTCAFDDISEIGPLCDSSDVWLHIDAAYAGAAFVCPEYRYLLAGVQHAQSFGFNAHKWLLVNYDCACLWLKDQSSISDAFNVDPLYLKHEHQQRIVDYRHLQIPLSRSFRSLKLWFVMRMYGISGLQRHIRKHVSLAHKFEELVRSDPRFEVTHPVLMGLVCFRLKNVDESVNAELIRRINESRRIHMVPARSGEVFYLRFVVCAVSVEESDILYAWDVIRDTTDKLLTGDNMYSAKG